MGDGIEPSFYNRITNTTFDWFFRDSETGKIDTTLIEEAVGETTSAEIQKTVKELLMKRYGPTVIIVGSSVFVGGVFMGYVFFKPSSSKRRKSKKK